MKRLVAAAALVLTLAACSNSSDGDATATVTEPGTTVTAVPEPSEPVATPTSTGCAPAGDGVPATAQVTTTIDLDGDGSPDQLWINDEGDTRTLGVTTASGATFTTPIDLAGPAGASAFALRPAPTDPALVLLSDNRVADLLMVSDCSLVAVTDAKGQPWQFDQGFAGQGTGVGCVDLTGDGQLDLVGLNQTDDTVERTQITLTGTVAAAGVKDSVQVTGGNDTAHQITCGDRTMDADGVHEAQG